MRREASILIVVLLLAMQSWGAESRVVIATVDGSPITTEEYAFALAPHVASLHELRKSAAADMLASSHRILTQALERSIEVKTRLLLAQEHALLADISYDAFYDDLQKENERRRIAFNKREVFYGPLEFSELAFFDYRIGTIEVSLKKMLGNEFERQLVARRDRARVEINEAAFAEILNQFVKRKS